MYHRGVPYIGFFIRKMFLGNIQNIVVFFNLHLYSRAQLKVIFLRGFAIEKNLQWLAHSSTHIHIYMGQIPQDGNFGPNVVLF